MLRQEQIQITAYSGLYEKVVAEDHLLRKIKENIDFGFVNPMLKSSYCEAYGRPAEEPERMFKLLFLKSMYDLSDEKLMEEAMCNMAFKYFLDLNPEDEVPDSSLLTKFRKTRIRSEDVLNEMLGETIGQAIGKGLVRSNAIIVDSTHTQSRGRKETPTQMLRRKSKELRKEIYRRDYELSGEFPEKPSETAELGEEIEYTKRLLERVGERIKKCGDKKLLGKYEELKALAESEDIKEIQSVSDRDAKTGHKSEDNSFFGYKSHLAINEERMITGIEVTTGESGDGKYLKPLVEKSISNGAEVKEVIGDAAYSGKDNIEFAEEKKIKLISRLNPVISNVVGKEAPKGFLYNKDADMFQCAAGHLSVKKSLRRKKNTKKNRSITYWFDVEKCKCCPMKDGCYKDGAKTRTYSVTVLSEAHRTQLDFENTEYFKERIKQRYKIEAKNGELKQTHGLGKAKYKGLFGMTLQTYTAAIVVNCKRIVRLMAEKSAIAASRTGLFLFDFPVSGILYELP
jgi:IS5 family transposase